ncbi:kinesin-like protein KIF27 [Aulostomus maculatus]
MDEVCVRVALRVRPLLPKEVLHKHEECLRVVPDSSQLVVLGSKRLFEFDYLFGPTATQRTVYESCVQPLLGYLLEGYNATVFCYGQTGSGKTYTLEGAKLDEEGGITNFIAQELFLLLEENRKSNAVESKVQVSYLELYKEELRDLLELPPNHKQLHVREDKDRNTVVVGAKEKVVTSAEELLNEVVTGNVLRHTDTTKMNEHSSRSHTILTLQLSQHCPKNYSGKTARFSKLCVVDLAGSERAAKTGNTGPQLKESAHINTDLLAVGNVIRALTGPGTVRKSNHVYVPFRGSKLTRLLRDSLGGTAHTLMVACVTPSNQSITETLSVLQFASKVRFIRNRPGVVTCPPEILEQLQKNQEKVQNYFKEEAQPQQMTIPQLTKCKETLRIKEQLLEQKDAELKQARKDREDLLLQQKAQFQALEAARECIRIQSEQLVEKQILIDRLRNNLVKLMGATSGAEMEMEASLDSGKRPSCVPRIMSSYFHGQPRKIHSSPPAFSLDNVMATFKTRGHLLLAEIEDKDEVYCPFKVQQAKRKDGAQEKDEEGNSAVSGMGSRSSLNRTWTRHETSALKEKITGMDQTSNVIQQPQRTSDPKEHFAKQCDTRNSRLSSSVSQRNILMLLVNMRLKEELIKVLDETDMEAQAVDRGARHSGVVREDDVLVKLSTEIQRSKKMLCQSLQQMRQKKEVLQDSLSKDREISDKYDHDQEGDRCWLEHAEELVLQKRAAMKVLGEEMRRQEEMVLERDNCLQQKNTLEIKSLRSSQALSQDVSMQSGPLENQQQIHSEEQFLFQLEENIEVLDAALEFNNNSIQNKQKQLSGSDSASCQSQNIETYHREIKKNLRKLSLPEALELLIKYFNKVVCLRETQDILHLRCEELDLHAGEQELVLKEMEVAMQHLALDADRRLTQQQRDQQKNIQLLLQKLKESRHEEKQLAIQRKLQNLEKDLFYYRSSNRQYRKKLKKILGDNQHLVDQPSHTREHSRFHSVQTHASPNKPLRSTEELKARMLNVPTDTKMSTEEKDKKENDNSPIETQQTPQSSSSSTQRKTKREDGFPGGGLKMTSVRLHRRNLRQISPPDPQVPYGSATMRRLSDVESGTEILVDSLEEGTHRDSASP